MDNLEKSVKYFGEDIVSFIDLDNVTGLNNKTNNQHYGLVVDSYADNVSDEELSDDENDLNLEVSTARVAFYPKGRTFVLNEDQLKLVDRSLMPGDVVRRMSGGELKGYVTDCQMTCSVLIKGTNKFIHGVDSKLFSEISSDIYNESVYVELDGWIGKTLAGHCKTNLLIQLADGETFNVDSSEAEDFEDLFDNVLKKEEESHFLCTSYYKGQQLKGPLSSLKSVCRVTAKAKKKKKKEVVITVLDIKVTQVSVQWLKCGLTDCPVRPGRHLLEDDIKRMRPVDEFSYAAVQIGDCYYYTIAEEDKIELCQPSQLCTSFLYSTEKVHMNMEASKNRMPSPHTHDKEPSCSKETGSASNGEIQSDVLQLPDSLDEGEKEVSCCSDDGEDGWEDVEEPVKPEANPKKSKRTQNVSKKKQMLPSLKTDVFFNFGDQVAVEVVFALTKVDVMWQDGELERGVASHNLYPVYHLDDYEFFPGDYVVTTESDIHTNDLQYGVVISVNEAQRVANIRWIYVPNGQYDTAPLINDSEVVSVYEIRDHSLFNFRPGAAVVKDKDYEMETGCGMDSVGSVRHLDCDGLMSVHWIDDCTTHLYPHQIQLISNLYESDSDSDDESESGASSWADTSDDSNDSLADNTMPEKELEDLGEELSVLVKNYERVLEPIQEIRQTCSQMPWDEFNEILSPLRKVADVYRSMIRLDNSIERAAEISISRKDVEEFQKLLEISDVYSNLSSIMQGVSSALSPPLSYFPLIHSLAAFHSHLKAALQNFPDSTDDICPVFVSNFVSVMQSVNSLLSHLSDGTDKSHFNLEELIDLCREKGYPVSIETNNDGDDEEAHVSSILSKIKTFDHSKVSDIQRQIIDFLCKFFTQMKEVTSTILEMYKSSHETASGMEETQNLELHLTESCPKQEAQDTGTEESEIGSAADKECVMQQYANGDRQGATSDQKLKISGNCPPCHKFSSISQSCLFGRKFIKLLQGELKILDNNLTDGIIVKGYEDRMNCFSAMIVGPSLTPYEGALFIFDIQLPHDYPVRPPNIHYHSYSSERLNPNLYVCGKVCVSLLGTWAGKPDELWNPLTSNLLQVLLSIQGLILVSEPYYNETGYEKQKNTVLGCENSKKYNEMVLVQLLHSMIGMLERPHASFEKEILDHWLKHGQSFIKRISTYIGMSDSTREDNHVDSEKEENSCHKYFPLLPLSKGCHLTLQKLLSKLVNALKDRNISV